MKRRTTAKLFKNGNSQAVRLPKEFRFEGDEVLIYREGDRIIMQPKQSKGRWREFFEQYPPLEDFMMDRKDLPLQKRDWF